MMNYLKVTLVVALFSFSGTLMAQEERKENSSISSKEIESPATQEKPVRIHPNPTEIKAKKNEQKPQTKTIKSPYEKKSAMRLENGEKKK